MNHLEQYRTIETADAEKVSDALRLLNMGEFAKAETVLKEVVRNSPKEYVGQFEDETTHFIKFWDKDEHQYFLNRRGEQPPGAKEIVWLANAYPRACYYLGMIKMNAKAFREALPFFDQGLAFDPDNARLWAEKGRAYGMLGNPQESIACYDRVLARTDDVIPPCRAAALRGKGVQLIELRNLAEAETLLRESLRFDPYNEVAHAELAFIEMSRNG